MKLEVNGEQRQLDVDPEMPLLWVLRDILQLTGTKYGCGIAACGACTVHLDGKATYACTLPVKAAEGKAVTTIEGLGGDGDHPLQQAWAKHNVPQCGYCQSGQLMRAAYLLAENPKPSEGDIVDAMRNNICRCGTYQRILAAIKDAAGVAS